MRRTMLFVVAVTAMSTAFARADVRNELAKLLPSDGEAGDRFGYSIAIDNGVVAIGAKWDNDNGTDSGSAYLFDASTGAQIVKLVPGDGALGDEFGFSIAIDNGVVAVGAVLDDDNGSGSGSAYLFDASTGAQIAKLLPNDGETGDNFGVSIAIDNGVVGVGAKFDDDNGPDSGSVYLFDASTGVQIAKLVPSDGAAEERFGHRIAIDNGVVAVGAVWDDDNGEFSGSAYLFDAATGAQIAKLLPSDGESRHQFGFSIAIDNGVVAVGALSDDDNGPSSGSAYLFDASTGAEIAKLLASDGAPGDWFGYSIAIDNGVVGVGARRDDDNGTDSGTAYLFHGPSGVEIAKLLPSDGSDGDQFGFSISIDNDVVVVGADWDDDNGFASGSAYVFDVGCPADIDGDGDVDVEDFLAYLELFAAGDTRADIDGDGDIDADDFFGYLDLFGAGC